MLSLIGLAQPTASMPGSTPAVAHHAPLRCVQNRQGAPVVQMSRLCRGVASRSSLRMELRPLAVGWRSAVLMVSTTNATSLLLLDRSLLDRIRDYLDELRRRGQRPRPAGGRDPMTPRVGE